MVSMHMPLLDEPTSKTQSTMHFRVNSRVNFYILIDILLVVTVLQLTKGVFALK